MKLLEISQSGAQELHARLTQAREGLDLSYWIRRRPDTRVDEAGILHLWIHGPLMQADAPIYRDLGSTFYEDIAAELATAGIRGVLLHVDSPGGTVAGCIEVARLIESLSVPCVSFVHGCACSAAFKSIAGCDFIVATQSATVGNIGTILVWADTSAMMGAMGVELNAITNEGASLKSTGHLASLTDEQREFLQEGIDQAGADFRAHVERNRTVDSEVWRAGWYSGERAVSLGLVDALGSEADATARLHELIALTDAALV